MKSLIPSVQQPIKHRLRFCFHLQVGKPPLLVPSCRWDVVERSHMFENKGTRKTEVQCVGFDDTATSKRDTSSLRCSHNVFVDYGRVGKRLATNM